MFRTFRASNQAGTCTWCGRKLRKPQYRDGLGDYGDGFFCGLRCGYNVAVAMAQLGRRFKPSNLPPPPPPKKHMPPPVGDCPTCGRKLQHETTVAGYYGEPVYVCRNLDCGDYQNHIWFNRSGECLGDTP